MLNNFFNSGTEQLNRHNYDGKIDWLARSNLTIFGKYSRMDAPVRSQFALGEVGGPGLSRAGVGFGETQVNIGTTGFTWTLSPTFLIDGTFAYTRFDQSVVGPDHGQNIGSEVWGIPGTNDPIVSGPFANQVAEQCPTEACYSGIPLIQHGFTDWGNPNGWLPLFRAERAYTYTTNMSKIYRSHELRWGFDLVRYHLDHWQPEINFGPRGRLLFGGGATALNGGAAPNFLNQYAGFLLGTPTEMNKAVQFFEMTNREWQFAWYIRDRWQVTRNLTVNLGLRYEYFPLISRRDRGIERWDPATNMVHLGGIGGQPEDVGISVSNRLFAPRVGFAYRLNENTVVRSGYGITYDPVPFSRPLRGLYPAAIGADFPSANPFVPVRSIEEGIPAIPLPDISAGLIELPPSVSMGPRSPWGGQLNRGYIQSWNFTSERRLPAHMVSSIAYVGTQTVNQLADRDINAAPPGAGPQGRPLFAVFGRDVTTNMWDGWLSGNYHSMQIALNRQFHRGLFLKGAYTWSKTINMTDDTGWAGVDRNWEPMIPWNRAVAGYDRTHMFTLGYVYEFPFGGGRPFAQSGVSRILLGGWQSNGMLGVYSGTPFTVTAAGASLNAPGNLQTADQVAPDVERPKHVGPGQSWFDPLAFRPITDVRFGNSGRNAVRGPGMFNFDLSLFRNFSLTERLGLEFRAEAFNLTNTPKFANPNANASNMSLGQDGSIVSLGNFSSVTSTLPNLANPSERQIRFGLRLSF
ncbi:MAG: TonB-dependent receptor [Bryobacteraceae bacterium]|nr:TonB-dependent receptor [Bryobacteraceae bacterium]